MRDDAYERSRHEVEAEIRYLTKEEGGRPGPVFTGYRGQFHYEGEAGYPFDGFQFFPDHPEGEPVPLGTTVSAVVSLRMPLWDDVHSKRMRIGTRFQIQEGPKIVGRGVITALDRQGKPSCS